MLDLIDKIASIFKTVFTDRVYLGAVRNKDRKNEKRV